MDGETACRDEARIVFAVDQPAFEVGPNRFCVLYPLMTVAGDRFEDVDQAFPYRGRVWWLLRSTLTSDQVVPGMLWTGGIEMARQGEKDRFQVRLHEIQPGDPDLVEILDIPQAEPGVEWIHRQKGLPWPRPTTARVWLRGRSSLLGPLSAHWEPAEGRLRLAPPPGEDAEVWKLSREAFSAIARVEEFRVELGEYTRNPIDRKVVDLAMTRTSWVDASRLRLTAESVDATSDAEVIRWATRQMPRKQRQQIQSALQDLREADPVAASGVGAARKRERLRQLIADRERVLELGEDVARDLAETPAFEELVRQHADTLVTVQVEDAVRRRNEEIEARTAARRDELRLLEGQAQAFEAESIARLDREIAARKENDEERSRSLDRREAALSEREGALDGRAEALRAGLDRAVEDYEQRTDRVVDELFGQWPVLRRLSGASSQASDPLPVAPASAPRLPMCLSTRSAPEGPPLSEADFLAQFHDVVRRAGFTFATEDLVNLHACVKTGALTILAGPSGTGKSSLPRLYAEALGSEEAYLHIPVRPDWLDDRDLLGAFNAIAGRFEPPAAGLVECLIAAAADLAAGRGGLVPICLDEMNLARVEHYFAQFLSVLELPEKSRALTLFAHGLTRPDDPYADHRRIPLGPNVRFLGTVNIDETTHFFSPKVLDRAQVVAFSAPDLAASARAEASVSSTPVRPVGLSTYLGWIRRGPAPGEARDFILRVNEVLRRSRLGLGFRQRDRMLDYVASARPFLAEDRALDFQLMQVVLPRLRPTAPHYKETLRALQEFIGRPRFPRAADMLGAILEAPAEIDFFQLL